VNILLVHGSPDQAHGQAAERLAGQVAGELGEAVAIATLGEDLPDAAGPVRVLPLFLNGGKHLREDVPRLVAACGGSLLQGPADFPDPVARMAVELAAAEGKGRAVLFALYHRPEKTGLPDALHRQGQCFPVQAIAALHGDEQVEQVEPVLGRWRHEDIREATVQPVLLFPGKSLSDIKRLALGVHGGPKICFGKTLSEHPGFPAWLARIFIYTPFVR